MSDDLLASTEDVQAALGRDLTPEELTKADAVLTKSSALFRLYSGQHFTPSTSDVWLTVHGGRVHLPQHPVTRVHSVLNADGFPVAHALTGSTLLVQDVTAGQIRVAYSHGSADVPTLVRSTIADIVQKVLTIPEAAQAGVQQKTETTGPFSETYTYAAWALGGQASFSPDDRRIAESYRLRTAGTIRVSPIR